MAYDGRVLPLQNIRATRAALVQIRPGFDGLRLIDADRHPRLMEFASKARKVSSHPEMWARAYRRFGDEMEAAMADVLATGVPPERAALPFLNALPDMWLVTGHRSEELSDDFFRLWNLLAANDLAEAVSLVDAPLPSRARELAGWLDHRLRVPRRSRTWKGHAQQTWEDVFGRTLRFPSSYGQASWKNELYAVTETDLYEFLDSGTLPRQEDSSGSLQAQLAKLRGTWSVERAALAAVIISYPMLITPLDRRYPLTASYVEQLDWTGAATVAATLPSADVLEDILRGTENFDVGARIERVAFGVPEAVDVLGPDLEPGQRLMWDVTVKLAESPHLWLPAILNTHASVEDVERVIGWMGDHKRYMAPASSVSPSWASFAVTPQHTMDAAWRPHRESSTDMMETLYALIRRGNSYTQVAELLGCDFSLEEVALVLGGMPSEYVRAMRPPEPTPPF